MNLVTDWSVYKNFSEDEFRCSFSGITRMQQSFMDNLQTIRMMIGIPLNITSGYRHESHPIEAAKDKVGEHSLGLAADVAIRGGEALKLIGIATAIGIPRIGVSQSGESRFIHLGGADRGDGFLSPWLWSY